MLTVFCNLAAVFTVPPLVAWIIAFEDVKLDAIALLVKLVLTVLLPLLVCRCIKPGIIPTKQTVFVEFLTINLKETEQAAPWAQLPAAVQEMSPCSSPEQMAGRISLLLSITTNRIVAEEH